MKARCAILTYILRSEIKGATLHGNRFDPQRMAARRSALREGFAIFSALIL
jgi:hypothetical protein